MASKKQYVIGAVVLVVLAAAAFFTKYDGGDRQAADQTADQSSELPEPGHRAPDFTLPTLADESQSVTLSELKGKPVFLNFWASWCGPCKQEMPDLQQVYEKYKDQVVFYTVNLTEQDDVKKAQAFLQQYDISIPGLIDPQSQAMKLYKVISIPTSYAIDADGIIAEKRQGAVSGTVMDGILQRLLATQTSQEH